MAIEFFSDAMVVRELSRAVDIVDRTKRKLKSGEADKKKRCQKAMDQLNRVIVDTIGIGEEEAG